MRNLISSAVMAAVAGDPALGGAPVNTDNPAIANSAAAQAAEAAKAEQSECGRKALQVIRADIKSAAKISEGVFEVIQAAQDWAEADTAFAAAENRVMHDFKVKSMAELARVSGVKQFSYVTIRSTMISAVQDAEKLCKQLQEYYDFSYANMSKEDQAKNAHESVPDGFLNPWSSRYGKTCDEKPVTRFNRDRRLASDSVAKLDSLKRMHQQARDRAEADAKSRLQTTMQNASGTEDSAPAGSGGTAQGFSSGTRQASDLSVVMRQNLGQVINAVNSAADVLPDEMVIPILTRCADEIIILVEQARQNERDKASEAGKRPVGRLEDNAGTDDESETELPELTPTDIRNIDEVNQHDGPSAAEG